ncbi:MAG: HWE histidine kinase domain-containing protein [Amaricoccus sp.]
MIGQVEVSEIDAPRASDLRQLYELTDRLYRARTLEAVYEAALDAIISTLHCSRASILLFDSEGVAQFEAWRGLSESYRATLRGHSPWKPGEPDPRPIFVEDIEASPEPDWVKATIRAEGIRGLGFIPLAAQGAAIGKFMTYHATPHVFSEHEIDLAVTIARQVGFSIERFRAEDARRSAEDELRRSEERFRLMSEHAPVMIWMSRADGSCLHLNSMLRTFWNVPEAALADFDWRIMMHPDDLDFIVTEMAQALAETRPVSLKGRYRNAAGEWRMLQTDARPRFGANGDFLGMIGVNVDMTEREQADAQRELLLAELNHRVKNTLAVVQAIAHQTFKNSEPASARTAFDGRIAALAAAHNLLTRANWECASLEQIADDALRAHSIGIGRVSACGPRVMLPPKDALAIAIALHELFTNALKYGALSSEAGQVTLEWRESPEGRVSIVWQENGGPTVVAPRHKGFGSLMLERMLAMDLQGTVTMDYRPEGLLCVIEAPLGAHAR